MIWLGILLLICSFAPILLIIGSTWPTKPLEPVTQRTPWTEEENDQCP